MRTHPIWVDVADLRGVALERVPIREALGGRAEPRPTTFDRERAFGRLRDLLAERNLLDAAIGTEHAFLPQAEKQRLTRQLDQRFAAFEAKIAALARFVMPSKR